MFRSLLVYKQFLYHNKYLIGNRALDCARSSRTVSGPGLEVWPCGHAPTPRSFMRPLSPHPGHHSPEQIYADVRRRIPRISLATVYNNLRLFVGHGLLREVSPHASTLLVEGYLEPHHHLV